MLSDKFVDMKKNWFTYIRRRFRSLKNKLGLWLLRGTDYPQHPKLEVKQTIMATTIKSVPVLREKAAVRFNSKAEKSIAKKSSVNFSKQAEIASKILKKAKI